MKVQMGDFIDMMGNISNNVQTILSILRRRNLVDEFVFKACSPRIVSQEEVTLRARSDVNTNILKMVIYN